MTLRKALIDRGFRKRSPKTSPGNCPRPVTTHAYHRVCSYHSLTLALSLNGDAMQTVMNPFDAGGYTLADMTAAINILPNVYTRLADLGVFRFEGVTQRSVLIEQSDGILNLLPTVPLGGP